MKFRSDVRKGILSIFALAALSAAGIASATSISAVPTAWRLQSYPGTGTVLWFTGSTCTNGQLALDVSDSADRNKLLWATVLAAKSSQIPVVIDYSVNSAGQCVINDFGLEAQ